MIYHYKVVNSQVGFLKLVATDKGLAAVLWEKDDPKRVQLSPLSENNHHPILLETERQLGEYFAGQRKKFSLKLDPVGTKFQNDVWEALSRIPFGETRSYRRNSEANRSRQSSTCSGSSEW
jgi:methylated-DNA-[protein]-cysteine S-methyltransferase